MYLLLKTRQFFQLAMLVYWRVINKSGSFFNKKHTHTHTISLFLRTLHFQTIFKGNYLLQTSSHPPQGLPTNRWYHRSNCHPCHLTDYLADLLSKCVTWDVTCPPSRDNHSLIGGWTNRIETYMSKWKSSSPIFGVKIEHVKKLPPPR